MLTIKEIEKILPHRYPFLFVDKVLELEKGVKIVGIKNVTGNEYFFAGHFPGHPIMPGVLIIEALAQLSGILMLSTVDSAQNKLFYFTGIDNARFRKAVFPGMQLKLEAEVIRVRSKTCLLNTKASVEGELVTEAKLMANLVER